MQRERLKAIYDKTRGRCWYCGASIHPLSDWQADHQHPRAQGGGDDLTNLVSACRPCNQRKGNRTVDQYRHSLLVNLEHAISIAYEISEKLEGQVGWETYPNVDGPPQDLSSVTELLLEAADTAVNLRLVFHGERDASTVIPSGVSEAELLV